MRDFFQYQTGNLYFDISFNAERSSGDASISLGCDGLTGKAIAFNLSNGLIKDSDGIIFGSYAPKEICKITGAIIENSCAYFFNGIPVRTFASAGDIDIDYIEFEKSGNCTGSFSYSYTINGKSHDTNKNLLYITNSERESGILGMIGSMGLFSGDGGIQTGYYEYTGILSSETLSEIDNYDMIVFGQYTSGLYFGDKTGWASVEKPILFLNPYVSNHENIGVFSGSIVFEDDINRTWAVANELVLNAKYNIYHSLTRRTIPNPEIIDYGSNYKTYGLFTGGAGYYHLNYAGYLNEPILWNDDLGIMAMVDMLEEGNSGYANGMIQNGDRFIFNVPYQFDQPLYDLVTENWKKIFAASIYDLICIKTEVARLSSGSSSKSSSSSSSSRSSSSSSKSSSSSSRSSSRSSSSSSSSKSSSRSSSKSSSSESSSSIAAVYGLRESLTAYWPMDGNLDDYGIYGQVHAECIDCPSYVSGIIGSGASFDGTRRIEVPVQNVTIYQEAMSRQPELGFNNTGDFTIQAWIKPSTTSNMIIISRYATGEEGEVWKSWSLSQSYGGRPSFFSYSGVEPPISTTTTGSTMGTSWNHICVVRSEGFIKLWQNGVYKNQSAMTGEFPDAMETIYIGGDNEESIRVSGIIDEVALWSRALTSEEIQIIYRGGTGLTLRDDV